MGGHGSLGVGVYKGTCMDGWYSCDVCMSVQALLAAGQFTITSLCHSVQLGGGWVRQLEAFSV